MKFKVSLLAFGLICQFSTQVFAQALGADWHIAQNNPHIRCLADAGDAAEACAAQSLEEYRCYALLPPEILADPQCDSGMGVRCYCRIHYGN